MKRTEVNKKVLSYEDHLRAVRQAGRLEIFSKLVSLIRFDEDALLSKRIVGNSDEVVGIRNFEGSYHSVVGAIIRQLQ